VMKQVCVRSVDLRGDGLQGYRLRTLLKQQRASRGKGDRSAFFWA
jgi:hypothetical protein